MDDAIAAMAALDLPTAEECWAESDFYWLSQYDYAPTAQEVADALLYFEENPEQLEIESDDCPAVLRCAVSTQRGEHSPTLVKGLLAAYPSKAKTYILVA